MANLVLLHTKPSYYYSFSAFSRDPSSSSSSSFNYRPAVILPVKSTICTSFLWLFPLSHDVFEPCLVISVCVYLYIYIYIYITGFGEQFWWLPEVGAYFERVWDIHSGCQGLQGWLAEECCWFARLELLAGNSPSPPRSRLVYHVTLFISKWPSCQIC